jgi:hypothetical protein
VWRKGLGTTHTQVDYQVWKSNFGNQTPRAPQGTPVSSAELSASKELQSFAVDGTTYTQGDLIQPTMVEYVGRPEQNNSIIVPPGAAVPSPGRRSELLTADFRADSGIISPAFGPTAVALSFSPPLVNGQGPDLVVIEITRSTSELPDAFQMQVNSTTGFLSDWGPQLSTLGFDTYSRDGGSPSNISELENDTFSYLSTFAESPLHGMAIDLDEFGVAPLEEVSTIHFGSYRPDSFDPVLFMGIRSAAAFSAAFNSEVPEPTSATLALLAWLFILSTQARVAPQVFQSLFCATAVNAQIEGGLPWFATELLARSCWPSMARRPGR